jgi:nucleoid-associated protein YgaU
MIDHSSRYANAAQAELVTPDGRRLRHLVPPILPQPSAHTAGQAHVVTDSDRADILAARAYGQATAWWLIANANTAAHPDQIAETPGSVRVIPVPEAGGGSGG